MNARQVFDAVKTPLTLLILLAILAFGGWWGWKSLMEPLPGDMPVPCVEQKVGANLETKQVTVNVFNGGMSRGLGRNVAKALGDKGFNLNNVGNAEERVGDTIVRGAKADNPEVKLVAGFFRNAKIEADNRVDHSVDVLVGNNWISAGNANSSFIDDAPTKIPVANGTVCLPSQSPSATASPSK